jgi:hypothetical protein
LHESFGIDAKEHAFIQDDSATAARLHAMQHVLNKEHLCRAGFVLVRGLRFLAFLSAERRIHQNVIEKLWRAVEQTPLRRNL